MIKLHKLLLFILLPIFGFTHNETLTADEIWGNYINTFGDKEEVYSIETYECTFEMSSDFGVTKGRMRIIRPDKVRSDFKYPNGAKVTFLINGDSGIIKSPGGIEPMPEEDLAQFKLTALIFPELTYQILCLNEDEKIEGKNYYSIDMLANNDTLTYLLYKDNFQVYRIIDKNGYTEVLETQHIDNFLLVKWVKYISEENIMVTNYKKQWINRRISKRHFKLK